MVGRKILLICKKIAAEFEEVASKKSLWERDLTVEKGDGGAIRLYSEKNKVRGGGGEMSKNSRSDILLEIERERDRIRYRLKKFKEIIKEVEAKERRAYYILGMLPAMDLDEHWSQDMYEAKQV